MILATSAFPGKPRLSGRPTETRAPREFVEPRGHAREIYPELFLPTTRISDRIGLVIASGMAVALINVAPC